MEQLNTDEELQIPLPPSMSRDAFVLFCNHILYHENANEYVGFGKHADWTYQYVCRHDQSYISWMRSLPDPSEGIERLLRWIDSTSNIQQKWKDEKDDINRVAQFFQVDLCSNCGDIGSDRLSLTPCSRAAWPNMTSIPKYDEVVNSLEESNDESHQKAWKDAWDTAEKEGKLNGRTVCSNYDVLCKNCISKSQQACHKCNTWECEQCQHDQEVVNHFEEWYHADPRTGDASPYKSLAVLPCLNCRRQRSCHRCGYECYACHRRVCSKCYREEIIFSAYCEECRDGDHVIEGDKSLVCKSCFDEASRHCQRSGCENEISDPNGDEDIDEDIDEDESDYSDYDMEYDYDYWDFDEDFYEESDEESDDFFDDD